MAPAARFSTLCAVLVALAAQATAQNLVQNHGFEATPDGCPPAINHLHKAVPWFNPTLGTPEHYHACNGNPFSVDVPDNVCGHQWGADGAAYGGFIAWEQGSNYHEYLANPFSQPMVAGGKYEVRFWVSLADKSQRAVGLVGAHLMEGPVGPFNTNESLLLEPHIENGLTDYITDKTGWTKIRGKYTAQGGEDHILIGTFRDRWNTPSVAMGDGDPSHYFAYYYVDLVYVYRVDYGDFIGPNPDTTNGGSDVFVIENMPPFAPVTVYWSYSDEGSFVNGQLFDLGEPLNTLMTGVTDANGRFTYAAGPTRRARRLGRTRPRPIHLEARVDDPATGQTLDTNPLTIRR